jgi:2-oxoglutarate dehydrogenase E2 component (dihydrolipoamide succinyltransferase)
MSIEIKAPTFPESVVEGTIATWHKKPGEQVRRDELLVDIETDKVVLEVQAPADGQISSLLKQEGDTVVSKEVIAKFKEGAVDEPTPQTKSGPAPEAKAEPEVKAVPESEVASAESAVAVSPAARKMIAEKGVDVSSIEGTGKHGLIRKEDVAAYLEKPAASAAKDAAESAVGIEMPVGERVEKRVPMTRLRQTIAKRLVQAQQTAAMLTTYNEVNMKPIMELRNKYKADFEKAHDGVRLGYMSFFVKAATEALKRFPAVNASIDGTEMVYHGYQDIGVAVSSPRGLVVPVLRNVGGMSLAQIESGIANYGKKARDGVLGIEDMTGGTFTISNGGVFGSLMSMPILNAPQTAILGMHKIQERPMAVSGEVQVLPMMYLALTYDHRMIDGREAVLFLVTIKELLEDPARILLEI